MPDTRAYYARAAKFQKPGHYTASDRDKIPPEDFAGPNQSYPIVTQDDVHDAAGLIGHADNPAAVKAKIKAIAKRKGFSLPDAWANEDNEKAAEPEEIRAVGDDIVEHVLTAPITRVDADRRLVTVTATSEAVDTFGTIFDYEASKDAFQRWAGNIREMHQPKAVGTRVGVDFDDAARKIDVTLRISRGAQDTWEKVLDGTLKGASIGASKVSWQHDVMSKVPRATKYDLVELSLVDAPSNPDAYGVTIMRSAQPDETILDTLDDADETRAGKDVEIAAAHSDPLPVVPEDSLHADDPDANAAMGGQFFGHEPKGGKQQLTTPLRDTKIDDAASVPAGSELTENVTEFGGPPADVSPDDLAAKRPQGVLGSEVRSAEGTNGKRDLAGKVATMKAAATAANAGGPSNVAGSMIAQDLRAAASNMIAPTPQLPTPTRRQQADAKRSALATARSEVQRAGNEAEQMARMAFGEWKPAAPGEMGETWDMWNRRIREARGRAEQQVVERQQAERFAAKLAEEGITAEEFIEQKRAASPAGQMAQRNQRIQQAQARATQAQQAQQSQQALATPGVTRGVDTASVSQSVRQAIVQEYLRAQAASRQAQAPLVSEPDVVRGDGTTPIAASNAGNAAIVQVAPVASTTTHALAGSGTQTHSDNPTTNSALVHAPAGTPPRSEKHRDVTEGVHSHRRADGTEVTHSHAYMDVDHDHVFRNRKPIDVRVAMAQDERAGKATSPIAPGDYTPSNPTQLLPVSGSAQTAKMPKPQSPTLSATMSNAGHLDILNTEDINQTEGGVPGETIIPPTPANSEVAPPALFHEGGHSGDLQPDHGLRPANHEMVGTLAPQQTGGSGGGHMDDDLDYDHDDDARERQGAGGRADEPDETRVGARVSAESRQALHVARGSAEQALHDICNHCGCDECGAKLDALAHAVAGIGNLPGDSDYTAPGRLMQAVLQRGMADLDARVQAQLGAAMNALLSRLTDLELTVADAQATNRASLEAEVTRSAASYTSTLSSLEQRLAPLTDIAHISQQVQAVAEVASGLEAPVAGIAETVERIASQPMAMASVPQTYAVNRSGSTSIDGFLGQGGQVSDLSDDQRRTLVSALQQQARTEGNPLRQSELAQLVMKLQPSPSTRLPLGRR